MSGDTLGILDHNHTQTRFAHPSLQLVGTEFTRLYRWQSLFWARPELLKFHSRTIPFHPCRDAVAQGERRLWLCLLSQQNSSACSLFHILRRMASSWTKLLHWAREKAAAKLERKLLFSLPQTTGCAERWDPDLLDVLLESWWWKPTPWDHPNLRNQAGIQAAGSIHHSSEQEEK